MSHDWRSALANPFPVNPRDGWPAYSFSRPDGTVATFWGSPYVVLVVAGHFVNDPPCAYKERPESVSLSERRPSGENTDKLFDYKVQLLGTTSVAKLRSLVGESDPPPEKKEVSCLKCNGEGVVECYHCRQKMDCGDCDGKGKSVEYVDALQRWLLLDGAHYRANYLARIVAALPPDDVAQVATRKDTTGCQFLYLTGTGWCVLSIAFKGTPDPEDSVATLELANEVPA
jgi:hypothetical protein